MMKNPFSNPEGSESLQKALISRKILESIKNTKKVCVANLIFNAKGELLLLQRSPNDDFHPGTFCLAGGKVDGLESPHTACVRETKEETSLYIANIYEAKTVILPDVTIHYFTSYVNPDAAPFITLSESEHQKYKFCTAEEWLTMDLILDLKEHLIDITGVDPDLTGLEKAEKDELEKSGIKPTMEEFKEGTLKSGSGKKVIDRKQAIAIGLSEEKEMKKGDKTTKTIPEEGDGEDYDESDIDVASDKDKVEKAFSDILEKSGIGSRGGKVIGYTKSGKPIYAGVTAKHKLYKDHSAKDHYEIAKFHDKKVGKLGKELTDADLNDSKKMENLGRRNQHQSEGDQKSREEHKGSDYKYSYKGEKDNSLKDSTRDKHSNYMNSVSNMKDDELKDEVWKHSQATRRYAGSEEKQHLAKEKFNKVKEEHKKRFDKKGLSETERSDRGAMIVHHPKMEVDEKGGLKNKKTPLESIKEDYNKKNKDDEVKKSITKVDANSYVDKDTDRFDDEEDSVEKALSNIIEEDLEKGGMGSGKYNHKKKWKGYHVSSVLKELGGGMSMTFNHKESPKDVKHLITKKISNKEFQEHGKLKGKEANEFADKIYQSDKHPIYNKATKKFEDVLKSGQKVSWKHDGHKGEGKIAERTEDQQYLVGDDKDYGTIHEHHQLTPIEDKKTEGGKTSTGKAISHIKAAGDPMYEKFTSDEHKEAGKYLKQKGHEQFSNSLVHKFNSPEHQTSTEEGERLQKLSLTHNVMANAKKRIEEDKLRHKK